MLNDFDTIVTFKQDQGIQLNIQEMIFLKAKKSDFKEIKNIESWSYWLASGVPFKQKVKQITLN